MNRQATILSLLLVSACVQQSYSYRPAGAPFDFTEGIDSRYTITWSQEWIDWAKSNKISLIGFYVVAPDCDGGRLHRFDSVAHLSLDRQRSLGIEVEGKKESYGCGSAMTRLILTPEYETKGFDSEDWVVPTVIELK